jgi:hypothetical protein
MLALLLSAMMLGLTAESAASGPSECTFIPNCDYGKGSRESGLAASRDACCTLCTNRPGCASGVWDGVKCWFKAAGVVKHGCQNSSRAKDACVPKSIKPGPAPTPPPPPPAPLSCPTTPAEPSKTLVAMVGDSITYGSGCSEWKYGFVKAMNDTLGGKYDLRDCGVSGLDAVKPRDGERNHKSYWSSAQYKASMEMGPEVVIIMLGTNDADEWCYAQNGSACPGGTSKHYATDLRNVSGNHHLSVADWQASKSATLLASAPPPPSRLSHACALVLPCIPNWPVDAGLHDAAERETDFSDDPSPLPIPASERTDAGMPAGRPKRLQPLGTVRWTVNRSLNPFPDGPRSSLPPSLPLLLTPSLPLSLAAAMHQPATRRFNGTGGSGEPEKERAKACIINCVLPIVIRQVAQELKLPAPVDMLSLFQFPGTVNKSLIPVLHPSCQGYNVMGQYVAKQLFGTRLASTIAN